MSGKSVILRNPTLMEVKFGGPLIEVMVGVELNKNGDEKSGYRQGVMVNEVVQIIQTSEIKWATELFMSKKYAWLVPRKDMREEEREARAKATEQKARFMASISKDAMCWPGRLDGWPNSVLADADQVLRASKPALVAFCRTLVGGSWTHFRRQTKEALACEIVCWAKREIEGIDQ